MLFRVEIGRDVNEFLMLDFSGQCSPIKLKTIVITTVARHLCNRPNVRKKCDFEVWQEYSCFSFSFADFDISLKVRADPEVLWAIYTVSFNNMVHYEPTTLSSIIGGVNKSAFCCKCTRC